MLWLRPPAPRPASPSPAPRHKAAVAASGGRGAAAARARETKAGRESTFRGFGGPAPRLGLGEGEGPPLGEEQCGQRPRPSAALGGRRAASRCRGQAPGLGRGRGCAGCPEGVAARTCGPSAKCGPERWSVGPSLCFPREAGDRGALPAEVDPGMPHAGGPAEPTSPRLAAPAHRYFAGEEPNSGSQLGGRTRSLVVGDRKKDKCPNWMESKPWAQTQTSLLRQLRWTPGGLCHRTLGRQLHNSIFPKLFEQRTVPGAFYSLPGN
ncbi:uncharacterized protein AAG666_012908 [Megaptera novaeangliae]